MDIEFGRARRAPDPIPETLVRVAEHAARDYGWRLTERGADTANLRVTGEWSDYDLVLADQPEQGFIEVQCFFALAPPTDRWSEVARLAETLNRSFHRGVLTISVQEDHGTYKDWVPRPSDRPVSNADLLEAMRSAVGTCDVLLFPAFHCVAWAEVTADMALDRINVGLPSHRYH